MKFHIQKSPYDQNIKIFAYELNTDNSLQFYSPDVIQSIRHEQGALLDEKITPFFELRAEDLAALMEAFLDEGIKPDIDAKLQGTLKATKSHLHDLQKLLNLDEEYNQHMKEIKS